MGKKIILIAVMVCLVTGNVWANNDERTTVGQIMISADHNYWQNDKIQGFGQATAFYNVNNSYMAIFLYGGPQFQVTDHWSLSVLGVSYFDSAGLSAGPSVWSAYVWDENCIFAESDYYVPVAEADAELPGHPHQYYGYAHYSRSFKDNVSFGFGLETMGNADDDKPFEFQYGPYIQLDNIRVWGFYDETPLADGQVVGVRLKLSF